MKKKTNLKLNLQLFSENGAEVNSESGEILNADAGQNQEIGIEEEFENLITGKFKEQFQKRTQSIIDKRFKETKQLEEFKGKVTPLLERLNEEYEIEDGDTDALYEKIFNRTDFNDGAEEKFVSGSGNLEFLKGQVQSWVKDGEKLKELYENFDFRNELKNNPLFGQLLYSGIPLKTAYEVLHKDEILSGAMAYTAQKVREQVVKGIEAKGRRPIENGMASESGIVTVTDVNALTSKDILKILKQVEKGASVKF